MLNSMNLTSNGHYPLKIKSMFDLAIASSQRYSISSPSQTPLQQHPPHQHHRHNQQINYSGSHLLLQQQHHQYNSAEMTHQHHHIQHHPKSHPVLNDNNNGGGMVTIEACSVGNGNGGLYPRSPQSDSSQKSNDSSMSPNASGEGRAVSPVAYNNNNVTMTPSGSVTALDCGGKSMGRSKQGQGSASSGGKPSFSMESLLAHSSGWRRQQTQSSETGGSKGISMKDNRFLPYHIPSPQQQQQQQPAQQLKRSSDNSGVSSKAPNPACQPSDNEKRADNFGGSIKSGGSTGASGRRATKSKRVRTIFTPEQLERLEAEFERQQYMVGPERLYLASSLYLTEAQVKVWFQNRRIKWRKQHLEMEQQRLAIYRTLAEQDMMASAGDDEDDDEPGEDSADCDYDMDETDSIAGGGGGSGGGGEGDHFPAHPNSQQLRTKVNHAYPLNCSPSAPASLHIGIHTSTSAKAPKSISVSNQNTKSERTRLPLQQASSNEDYDASSSTTHSSGSPTSFGGIASANKGDDYGNNNGNNLQGVKN